VAGPNEAVPEEAHSDTHATSIDKFSSFNIEGTQIIVTGRWLKVASVHDQEWRETNISADCAILVDKVSQSRQVKADLFTFIQEPLDTEPRYDYPYEWESVAVIPVMSFSDWWINRVSSDLRKDVRRAAKRGVVIRTVPFNDELVHAIMAIYNETPIRQGRVFRHFGESFAEVKRENSTYLESSQFVGAYFENELIGFLKIVYVGKIARLMQIIAKDAHRGRRPMNALIAKAVELVAAEGSVMLTYGKYRYSQGADTVTAFKARNGFEEVLIPRYYVPLSLKGRIFVRLQLHRRFVRLMPVSVRKFLKRLRLALHQKDTAKQNTM